MWNHVPSVPHDKHISNLRLGKPRYTPELGTAHKQSIRRRIMENEVYEDEVDFATLFLHLYLKQPSLHRECAEKMTA